MTDQSFILIIKAIMKAYYFPDPEGKTESAGLKLEQTVKQFRQEIEDDIRREKFEDEFLQHILNKQSNENTRQAGECLPG